MDKISKIIILVFVVSLFGALGFGILTEAGSEHNVSGFAWGETTGWVSFNSANCDSDGNGITDTGNFSQCPVGEAISNYGVNIDGDGKLSGYAWSEHIGWISFNESDLSGCPEGICRAEINPPSQLGKSNVDINGWARALAYAGGWDGWLKFDHGESDEPYIDVDSDWHGWAWGNDVVGWISFNGADSGAGGDYKVASTRVNNPPSASGLEVVKGDYCATPAHYFSWTYSDPDGDKETQFQFQVDDDTDFDDDGDIKVDSGIISVDDYTCPNPTCDNSNNQTIIVVVSPVSDQIGYNTTYYWRIMVWDSDGADSGWVEGSSFTTEEHRYPSIDFSWSPTEPGQGENVQFTDESACYDAACNSWAWIFANGSPASSSRQNPIIQFTSEGSNQVTLRVTDSDNFSCQVSKSIGVQAEPPCW